MHRKNTLAERMQASKERGDALRAKSAQYGSKPLPIGSKRLPPASARTVAYIWSHKPRHKPTRRIKRPHLHPRTPMDTLNDRAQDMRLNPTRHEMMFSRMMDNENVFCRSQEILAPYIVDFYFPDDLMAVEIDGPSHYQTVAYDRQRDKKIMYYYGVEVIRFTNADVQSRKAHVIDHLKRMLKSSNARVNQVKFSRVESSPSPKGGTTELTGLNNGSGQRQ